MAICIHTYLRQLKRGTISLVTSQTELTYTASEQVYRTTWEMTMCRWYTEASWLTRREVVRAQPHYFNEIFFFLEYNFFLFFQGFSSQHDFLLQHEGTFLSNFFLTTATQAPDMATYVFTTRAIQMIKIKIKAVKSHLMLISSGYETQLFILPSSNSSIQWLRFRLINLLYKAAVFIVCLSVCTPPLFRHDRRTATKFGTHIRVDTGLILS